MSAWTSMLVGALLIGATSPLAATWHFNERIAVTPPPEAGVFHHLDSAGRKNIALSGDWVGVAWEDNSNQGAPKVFFSVKSLHDSRFGDPLRISGNGDAYEPVVAALGAGRYLLAWEEDSRVWCRTVRVQPDIRLGRPMQLSEKPAGHASVAVGKNRIYLVWRERLRRYPVLMLAEATVKEPGEVVIERRISLEKQPATAPQLYPAIVAGDAGVTVAWEDRRAGHTRLLVSHSADAAEFSPPVALNEFLNNRTAYDKGNGVTRVALAAFGEDEVVAAWMDKRRSGKGYGIYAALGSEGGSSFGPNERVQDSRGDELPHYNPAVAGNVEGRFLVAWDDHREGTSDIWLSGYSDELEWGQDFSPPPASGDGEQTNPSIALGADGRLHLVWIERGSVGAPSRIWYASAEPPAE